MPVRRDREEAEELANIVGTIYDAALDPELWPEALRLVARFVPGCVANIFSQDAVNNSATRYFSWGDDPHYTKLYLEEYAAGNPVIPPTLTHSPGEVFGMYEVVALEEMKRAAVYTEYMVPQGYVDSIACLLEKSATSVAICVVIRHERDGWIDAGAKRRFALLAPHIRRAVMVGKIIDLRQIAADRLAETIDGLATGILLVDRAGRLVRANAAGQAMLDAGVPIRLMDGGLAATETASDLHLRNALDLAAKGDGRSAARGIGVPLKGRGPSVFIAHVLPLTSGARKAAGLHQGAAAALFVREAGIDLPTAIEAAGSIYRLTPAEIRVLGAVIEAAGVPLVPERLGLSRSTVRSQLRSIFQKTGTRRQSELIKLIAGFDSPSGSSRQE